MGIWSMIFTAIIVLNTIGAIITVFKEKRDVAATWAWLLTLNLLPVAGFIIYLFIGKKMSKENIYDMSTQKSLGMSQLAKVQIEMLEDEDLAQGLVETDYAQKTAILFLESDESILTKGNKVEIFKTGADLFDSLVQDIYKAENHVHMLYYTFRSDDLGKRILAALENRAAAGVEVLVVYDAMGCRGNDPRFFNNLEKLGGKTEVFFGSKIPFVNLRMNYRNHRKIMVVDAKVAYLGGFNIGDEYLGKGELGEWRDTHMKIEGNAVLTLQSRFFMDWNAVAKEKNRKDYAEAYFPIADKKGNTAMQIVASGPDDEDQTIKMGFLKMISQAKESIYIQTPYFIPDESLHEMLKIAVLSGVKVKIMIPSKPDHPFVYRATEYFAKDIVEYGAEVYMYQNGFLHSKVMVVDDEIVSVGTANMDVRSFKLNFEINAFIYDRDVAEELIANFDEDQKNCIRATHDYFAKQSKWRKFKQAFSRLLSPIL